MTKDTGRKPKIDIKDEAVKKQIKVFGRLLATHQEMADFFEVHLRTIQRHMKVSKTGKMTEFCRIYKKEAATTKTSLRRTQVTKALKGDTSMLIWLGKQLLEQKDKIDKKIEHEDVGKASNKVTEENEAILERVGIHVDNS